MAKRMQHTEIDERNDECQVINPLRETALAERYPEGCMDISVNTPPDQWPTSLQVNSPEWKAALVNAACTPDLEIGAEWSEPIEVTDWLIMIRETADPTTGEVNQYPWLTLIAQDGTMIGTSSAVVPHQLARMLRAYSAEEWKAGIKVRFRRRMNRQHTKTYHEMRIVP